jgi:hypothetical protein
MVDKKEKCQSVLLTLRCAQPLNWLRLSDHSGVVGEAVCFPIIERDANSVPYSMNAKGDYARTQSDDRLV